MSGNRNARPGRAAVMAILCVRIKLKKFVAQLGGIVLDGRSSPHASVALTRQRRAVLQQLAATDVHRPVMTPAGVKSACSASYSTTRLR